MAKVQFQVDGLDSNTISIFNDDVTFDGNVDANSISIAGNPISNVYATISSVSELAQDAIGTNLSSVFTYNDSTGGIGINNAQMSNFLLDGASGNSYGLIGTSEYLDIKNTNGYNKEIELDIAAVESKLVTDGFATLSSPTFTGTVDFTGATVNGISSYLAPTLGSTLIASGNTVTSIGDLTLNSSIINLPSINNIKAGYSTTAAVNGTTVLTSSSNKIQNFTGTTSGQFINMPVTSTLVPGVQYEIHNNASTGILTVRSSGSNTITTVNPGSIALFTCIGTTLTTAADWTYKIIGATVVTGSGSAVYATSPTISSATLTNPIFSSIQSGSKTLTFPTSVNDEVTVNTASQNLTNKTINLSGTSATPAIKISSSTLLSTVSGGSIEKDAYAFYATPHPSASSSSSGGRQMIDTSIHKVLGSLYNLNSISTSAQGIFGSSPSIYLAASTTYKIEGFVAFTNGSTSHNTTFSIPITTGSYASSMINYKYGTSAAGLAMMSTEYYLSDTLGSSPSITIANSTTNTAGYVYFNGIIRLNAAGPIKPSLTFSAATGSTPAILQNSWIKITPLGMTGDISVGSWSI